MSVTSRPARRSAASSSGRESGLRPGAPNALRTSAASASSRCGRAPRGGRGPSRSVSRRSWTSTAQGTPAYVISAATRAPADSAASSSAEPGGLGRGGHRGQLPGVLEVGAQVLGRVVDREQRRMVLRARAEPVPVLGLLPLQQLPVHLGRATQQVVAQPQVVAPGDPHAGRQQRRVPPRGVVPHPARAVDLARADVRRQVGERTTRSVPRVHDQHPVARQAREVDPGHGDTLTPGVSHRRPSRAGSPTRPRPARGRGTTAPHGPAPPRTAVPARPSSRAAASPRRDGGASSSAPARRRARRWCGRPPAASRRPHVPGRQPGPPTADRYDGQVDRRPGQRGEVRHPRVDGRCPRRARRRRTAPARGDRWRRWAGAASAGSGEPPGRAGPLTPDPPTGAHSPSASPCPTSPLPVDPRGVLHRRQHRHGAEHPQGRDLGVVVVQVGQQDGVRVPPRLALRSGTTSPEDAVVAPEERVRDEPHAVDVEDDGRVAEPGQGDRHGRPITSCPASTFLPLSRAAAAVSPARRRPRGWRSPARRSGW